MHSVCCCSLPTLKMSFRGGPLIDLFWPCPGSTIRRILVQMSMQMCRAHEYFIPTKCVKYPSSDSVVKADSVFPYIHTKRKRKRSDSVLWQKPLHQQKCQKGKVTTQTTPQKSSIKQRLRTDLGRSVGVTTATQLVWLTGLRAHLPTNRNSRLIKRTHV